MKKSLRTKTVEEICECLIDYRGKTPRKTDSGVKLITAKVIKGGRIEDSEHEYIAEEEYDSWMRRGLPQTGDVLVTTEAPLGEVAPIPADERVALAQRVILMRVNPAICDSKYLLYVFQSRFVQAELTSRASGCTVIGIKNTELRKVRVPLPILKEQERIGRILSAYDELMENNRRRMALLEQSARLLYQEWFVRLRFPGHERSRIVDDRPEGWIQAKLSEWIDITHGYAFDGEHFSDATTSRVMTTPGNFRIGGGIKIDRPKYYSDDGPLDPDYVLSPGDLVVTMTDLSVMSDTLGYPALIPEMDGVAFLHNQRVGRVVPLTEWFPRHFLFFVMCDARYRYHVLGSATGTSVKHTAPKRILSYSHRMPPRPLVGTFEATAAPFFEQWTVLLKMNQKLRAARDLLLPRLMSGEIAV